MLRFLAALTIAFPLMAQSPAELAQAFAAIELDPNTCYRVRDLPFQREDLRFYFNEGYLLLGKPVGDLIVAAVFVTDGAEGGDAEVLLFPPNRAEREAMAAATGSPNLNEHFASAAFLFTDDSGAQLLARMKESGRPSPDNGLLIADRWNRTVRNLAASFETRLLLDLLTLARPRPGMFFGALQGRKLGNFDVYHDPRAEQSIVAGRTGSRDGKPHFDIWTLFDSRSRRTGAGKPPAGEFTLQDYRIEATVEPPKLAMQVVTRVRLRTPSRERVFPFEISGRMQVQRVTIDGEPAEVLLHESLRSNLLRNSGNVLFLVAASTPLEPDRDYEVVFDHRGDVIEDAGNEVYLVTSRGGWYPVRGLQFSHYDLTFRYPAGLQWVAAGEVVADEREADVRITRRRTAAPIRVAGFNLGIYQKTRVERGGIAVEVYANKNVEQALEALARPPGPVVIQLPAARGAARRPDMLQVIPAPPPPQLDPKSRLESLAQDIASALEFFTSFLGPPPLSVISVSPVPGWFGQGFPGMVYLSTLSYLGPRDRPITRLEPLYQVFFTQVLAAHEAAHQWWGNAVTPATYQDEWLMEALANYSALLFLEKKQGRRVLEEILDAYRAHLLAKDEAGKPVDATGPIAFGARLVTSQSGQAWRTITYEKGSWILHMLRRNMGDDAFLQMLGELRRRFSGQALAIDQFRRTAAEFLPPKSPDAQLEAFFDHWVYSTGIPAFELKYQIRGKAPAVRVTGTLSAAGVSEEAVFQVPVDIHFSRTKKIRRVFRVTTEPTAFELKLGQAPVRVALDPDNSILSIHR